MKSRIGTFFEVGIRLEKTMEDGSSKKVTEKYAVDAMSFTEAESIVTKKLSDRISGDFEIKSEAQAAYHEISFSEKEGESKWYKAKVLFITLDEKTEREKRTVVTYLVQGSSMRSVLTNIEQMFGTVMFGHEVIALQETKIIEVFFHDVEIPNVEILDPEWDEKSINKDE